MSSPAMAATSSPTDLIDLKMFHELRCCRKGQIGLRQDFDTKDFRRRVAKKMDDKNFTKTYQEFIKPEGRPEEFTIEGIATKFEAAAQKVNAPKRQTVKNKNIQVENQHKLGG